MSKFFFYIGIFPNDVEEHIQYSYNSVCLASLEKIQIFDDFFWFISLGTYLIKDRVSVCIFFETIFESIDDCSNICIDRFNLPDS